MAELIQNKTAAILGKAMNESLERRMREFLIVLLIYKGRESTEALHDVIAEVGKITTTYFSKCHDRAWLEWYDNKGYRITDEGMKIIEEGLEGE